MKLLKQTIIIFSLLLLNGILLAQDVSTNSQNWKEKAWERIDSHRKSNLSITVLSETGVPLKNANVKIKLKRHSFNFGAVVRSETFNTSPYSNTYKELYIKYFNGTGMSLGLKPKQREKIREEYAEQAIPWFNQNKISVRGHALVWEGKKFLPTKASKIYKQTNLTDKQKGEKLLEVLGKHLYHALPKWNVVCWDVVNEPIANHLVNDLLPDYNTFTHWFKLADSLRKVYNKQNVKLVLNENQIISGNTKRAIGKIDKFQTVIDKMLAEGAPIEMLGFQSRIKMGMLSPEIMYERLLRFDKYNLPYQATEFEIRDTDKYSYTDEEVKQLTEETMIIYFSHPKVEGFWHWTFVDTENEKHPWALFNYNGTPKPTGEKWIELMEGKFNTNISLTTNNLGNCSAKAFKGEYELEITYDNSTTKKSMILNEDTNLSINISLKN